MADFSHKSAKGDKLGPGLTLAGQQQVSRILELVKGLEINPKIIFTSPLRRAVETANLAHEQSWNSAEIITTEALLPNSTTNNLFSEIKSHGDNMTSVAVSHYPLIGKVINDSLGFEFGQEIPNGAILRVDFKGKPVEGKGKLIWIVPPITS